MTKIILNRVKMKMIKFHIVCENKNENLHVNEDWGLFIDIENYNYNAILFHNSLYHKKNDPTIEEEIEEIEEIEKIEKNHDWCSSDLTNRRCMIYLCNYCITFTICFILLYCIFYIL